MKKDGRYMPDSFQHELIMVVREEKGLVIFTGCAHKGILNIIDAVKRHFKNETIRSIFGGFHLMAERKRDVRSIGKELGKYCIGRVYTGHCTGRKAASLLKEVMGEKLVYFATGSEALRDVLDRAGQTVGKRMMRILPLFANILFALSPPGPRTEQYFLTYSI